MKTKAIKPVSQKGSRILDAVYENATGMFKAGVIDKRRMATYELLCVPKLPSYPARRIRAIRHKLNLSQAVLATVLNTSLSTIRQWEIGQRRPGGPSQKLLYILEKKGLEGMI